MKTQILLDRLIRKVLLEQDVAAEVQYNPGDIRRGKIVAASRKHVSVARQNGAVSYGWPAFSIKMVTNSKTSKALEWTGSRGAAEFIQLAMGNTENEGYYGWTYLDQDEDNIPYYMYVVGPNVAKRKKVRKHNVWVCDYRYLYRLSQKIDNIEPLQYFEYIESMLRDKAYSFSNIPIFDYADLKKWLTVLNAKFKTLTSQQQSDIKKSLPAPLSTIQPESINLSQLSVDIDAEADSDEVPDYTKTENKIITDDNAKEYNNTNFRGEAKLSYSAAGAKVITFISGSYNVREIETNMPGRFFGKFKDGAPFEGYIKNDDGTRQPEEGDGRFEEGAVQVTVDKNGKRSFIIDPNYLKPIGSADDKKDGSDAKASATGITYPYKIRLFKEECQVITIKGDKEYVYAYVETKGLWYFAIKADFESNETADPRKGTTFSLIEKTNKKAYNKLKPYIPKK